MDYLQPGDMAAAIEALSLHGSRVIAGGTDIYPASVGKPLAGRLVDVSGVAEMREIAVSATAVRIGGAVTWSEIARADLPPAFAALQQAALQVGSQQVQNRGTIAGNLCNASPAADGVPPLLVLDAEVELASAFGVRRLPLCDFIAGYRKTQLQPGEFLAAVVVPKVPAGNSAFVKLGARKYLVISIVMAAALVEKDRSGAIFAARVAVGSASEKALRLNALEGDLAGLAAGRAPSALLGPEHFDCLSPIDDVRATAGYRLEAARQLAGEALDRAAGF
jgi:CO/xanthine dehydrogenase FAD-binding subunit